jgi:hypothetical protein
MIWVVVGLFWVGIGILDYNHCEAVWCTPEDPRRMLFLSVACGPISPFLTWVVNRKFERKEDSSG